MKAMFVGEECPRLFKKGMTYDIRIREDNGSKWVQAVDEPSLEGKYKDLYKNWAFQHKEPLTRETLNNQLEFDMYIRNYFLRNDNLEFGYSDDDYYWEVWKVYLRKYEDMIIVEFSIGSESGYIETNNFVETMSIEELRQLILNKRFANEDIQLIDIVEQATTEMLKENQNEQ